MCTATPPPRFTPGFVRWTAPMLVGLALLTGCGTPVGSISKTSVQARTGAARLMPAALPDAVFAFETASTSPTTWTFTNSNGAVLHGFTSNAGDATFVPVSNNYTYVGGSEAILARSVGISSTTKWAVIRANGTSTPVASSLTPLLNTIGFPGTFLVAPSTLYMVQQFPNAKHPFNFEELNLATGTTLRSDSLVPLTNARTVLFEPENIDPAAHVLSFLIANTTFEGVKINALSVVTLNLTTNALAAHALAPGIAADVVPPAGIPQYLTNAYVSGDGSLLIYQTPSGSATYILDLKTGRTTTIASDMNLSFISGQNSVFYSPNDQYAALIGSGPSEALKFFILNTATGALVKNIAPLIPGAAQWVQIMDWAGATHLIYATEASTSASAERTYLFDIQSGTASPFPAAAGQFISVLP